MATPLCTLYILFLFSFFVIIISFVCLYLLIVSISLFFPFLQCGTKWLHPDKKRHKMAHRGNRRHEMAHSLRIGENYGRRGGTKWRILSLHLHLLVVSQGAVQRDF